MKLRQDFEHHLLALLRQRPAVDVASALRLLSLCQQQLARETHSGWQIFWTLASRYFHGLKRNPARAFSDAEAGAASHIMSGLLLRGQFDGQSAEGVSDLGIVNQLLFLEQADVLSQRLQVALQDCAEQPEIWSEQLPDDARSMAQLAQDMAVPAVQQLADALAAQLARLRVRRVVDDVRISLEAAQEVSRLLHQFAAGVSPQAAPQMLEALGV